MRQGMSPGQARRGIAALALCALACAPAWMGCDSGDSEAAPGKKEGATQEVKPMAVEAAPVRAQRFVQTFEFPGVAEPIERRRIAAESGGRVLTAPFEEGDQVEERDLLLRVDAKSTRAQIDVIESQVQAARREYRRVKQLASEGLATPQQLDQARSQREQAELSLEQAKVGKAMSVVRSPFDGVVATKFVEAGEFTGPGQPIVELYDLSTIKLEVAVPESAIQYAEVGEAVEVHFPATGRRLDGKIARRGVRVAQPTQTFPVEVHLPNAEGEILPGMRARVIVPKLELEQAVVVPRDALLEGVTQREAMVVEGINEEGVGAASLRVVTIGEARGNRVVIEEGLKPGELLIIKGHRNVVDGTSVRVVGGAKAPGERAEASPDSEAAPEPAQ